MIGKECLVIFAGPTDRWPFALDIPTLVRIEAAEVTPLGLNLKMRPIVAGETQWINADRIRSIQTL